ncbi:hypothetical protein LIA77_02525 [Sarocladium implicatum]|nr:hypothetical protein LIA77_02525 [Sarocladium implicatum]
MFSNPAEQFGYTGKFGRFETPDAGHAAFRVPIASEWLRRGDEAGDGLQTGNLGGWRADGFTDPAGVI